MMRRAGVIISAAAIVLFACSALAQSKDFSGTWTIDANKTALEDRMTEPTVGRGNNGPGPMTIAMDARTMTVTHGRSNGGTTFTYHLDGSKSRNTMPGVNGAPGVDMVSTAKWHGATLVITTRHELGDAVVKYSMDGANLRIESIIPFRRFVETPQTPATGARFGASVTNKTVVYTKG